MQRCLLWGTGEVFRDYVNLVKFHEMKQHFLVVGITSNTTIYSEYEGYSYIPKTSLSAISFDFVIVMARGEILKEIFAEACRTGISPQILYPCKVLTNTAFDIKRYKKLRENVPTIFSNNCWGGLTYHSLGLSMRSPLVNLLFETDEDYLRLLKNPRWYMREKLEFVEMRENEAGQYPVCRCGDIRLYFNHTSSFYIANTVWERRKQRINWDNLLVEMFTENKHVAKEFSNLPYEKKVCFVPFELDIPSLIYLEFRYLDGMTDVPLWKIVNGMATGAYPYYDAFTLLETGEIKKICTFRMTG